MITNSVHYDGEEMAHIYNNVCLEQCKCQDHDHRIGWYISPCKMLWIKWREGRVTDIWWTNIWLFEKKGTQLEVGSLFSLTFYLYSDL